MAQVLGRLTQRSDDRLLVGFDTCDDAGVFRLRADLAIVQTVDFFPPLVDDPYVFGQIAAANSLSDIYAMGAMPLTALNIVAFPDDELPADVLADILRGGADKAHEADTTILGGHSVRDREIKYGLAVTGTVHPDDIITNAGARPGDALVLTKPIGTGTLTSAAKAGRLNPDDLAEAIRAMTRLNRDAAEAIKAVGVHAATDITGFGLLGHAHEMAVASGVGIRLRASAVPLLEHTLPLARRGMVTRAWKTTIQQMGDDLRAPGVDETLLRVVADAQTSGGLLIAVAAERCEALRSALKDRGALCDAVVGEVVEPGRYIEVVP